jgi:hypothetical protein
MRICWSVLLFGLTTVALSNAARADGYYGALASGISGSTVGVGYASDYPSQPAADAEALRKCEQITSNCTVVGRFYNGGCGYIATTASSGTCWGSGSSPSEATNECQSRGCGPCKTPIGACTKAP